MSQPVHPHLRALLLAGTMLTALPLLSGCILAAAGAGAAGGYSVFGQEEGAGDQIKDKAIAAQTSKSWNDYSSNLADDLNVTVYTGRVLITGRVPNEEMRREAVQRAWKVDGVKEVYDEIEVGPDTHFVDQARDTIISTRLRNDLRFDSNIKSLNYTITTENGVVYVLGSARNQTELDSVTNYARNIPNVRRVVSYVRIRSGAPASAQPAVAASVPAPPPPPDTSADTPVGAPTPRAAIEVTPLK